MVGLLKLPIIDLSADNKASAADSILQACADIGFFYVINHGVAEDTLGQIFRQSKNFFTLPLEEKMKLKRKEHSGYVPCYSMKLDPLSDHIGDSKESFYFEFFEDDAGPRLNQWPSEDTLPAFCEITEAYHKQALLAGEKLLSLIALALDLDKNFFTLKPPCASLSFIHYPGGEIRNGAVFGASPHSDYGLLTLLATDGVPGLQVCREKDCEPRIWEDVPHIDGALIVNIGDMLERWTNCRFRSTLHRVMSTGQERYSAALFLDPHCERVVECLESCCSEFSPPKFPPIRSGEYLEQRLRGSYVSISE